MLIETTDHETADEALSMADRLRLEGGAGLLLDQMTDRFGPVSDDVRARLKRASPTELRAWARRVVRAATLEEVFA